MQVLQCSSNIQKLLILPCTIQTIHFKYYNHHFLKYEASVPHKVHKANNPINTNSIDSERGVSSYSSKAEKSIARHQYPRPPETFPERDLKNSTPRNPIAGSSEPASRKGPTCACIFIFRGVRHLITFLPDISVKCVQRAGGRRSFLCSIPLRRSPISWLAASVGVARARARDE